MPQRAPPKMLERLLCGVPLQMGRPGVKRYDVSINVKSLAEDSDSSVAMNCTQLHRFCTDRQAGSC